MTVPVKTPPRGEIMESVLIKGDLSKLSAEERSLYYMKVCESVGFNPLTRPLEYIMLNGKLTLYAKRDAADQLRKINGISIEVVSREHEDGLLIVHVRAKDGAGRTDEDLGAVAFPDNLKGEARANAILKAVTKAKRRVTLSISGLGFLDETEIEDIPASPRRPVAAPNVMLPPHDPQTGEIVDGAPAPAPAGVAETESPAPHDHVPDDGAADDGGMDTVEAHDRRLAEAAKRGTVALMEAWRNTPKSIAPTLKAALDRRHKAAALEADKKSAEQQEWP